jgi:hypothetical protein
MNCCRLSRVLLCLGLACLLALVIPYYSHEPPENPSALPEGLDQMPFKVGEPGRTVFSLGLPASPWFSHVKSVTFTTTPGDVGGAIKVNDPDKVKVQVTNFSFGYNVNSHVELISWSVGIAAVGVLLIIGARLTRRTKSAVEPSVS